MVASVKETITKLYVVAGLFHDIGKFEERAEPMEMDMDEVRQEHRYAHAYRTERVLTSLFGERVSQHPSEFHDLTALNLASRHHKPRNNFELIMAEADRIAAGHERMGTDATSEVETSAGERKSRIPLVSILSRIQLDSTNSKEAEEINATDWRYRLRPLSKAFDCKEMDAVFPCPGEVYAPEEVREDYRMLWEGFQGALEVDPRGRSLDLFDNFETIYEICREFMWCIPESTQKGTLEDVSLFEHSRLTAAISACLYTYHADKNGMVGESSAERTAIKDRAVKKFLLFCGDISGIQRFVYQISSKGAYRTLKGRSFFIQLLTEILARNFVDEFGLSLPNILYASGGKFYALLPNIEQTREKLTHLSDKLNAWLFDRFAGELYVRGGFEVLSAEDLTRKNGRTLYDIWNELTLSLFLTDRKRYQNLATNQYEAVFGTGDYKPYACEVCHVGIGTGKRCLTCTQMEELGATLRNSSFVAISRENTAIQDKKWIFELSGVFSKDSYVWLLSDGEIPSSVSAPTTFLALNKSKFAGIPLQLPRPEIVNSGVLIVGSNLSFDKTFDEIARESEGIKRLGILRMDVDNLGKIFSQGLKYYRHARQAGEGFYSLGRITTLSSQLNLFFGAIVPQILKSSGSWAERVTVVYSGGDDLFLLGAWDAIPDIAFRITQRFQQFTCHSPYFSLSAGVTITGGKFPIYKGAELAGEAEEMAKANKYRDNAGRTHKKNSLTFLNVPTAWPEFEELRYVYHQVFHLVKKKKFYPLLRRLREIAHSWEKERATLERSKVFTVVQVKSILMAERWRWRMIYSLSRFSEAHREIKERIEELQSFITDSMDVTNRSGIELLGLLSRWLEFSVRDEFKKEGNDE